jgi:hypothetical protein
MMGTTTPGELPPAAQARAREGVEHLQAAARELIAAARAALDVAEEVVNDPEAVSSMAGTLSSVGDLARRLTGTGGWPLARSEPGGDDYDDDGAPDDEPRVQRITVT